MKPAFLYTQVYSKVVDVMSRPPAERETYQLLMIAEWFQQKSKLLKKITNGMEIGFVLKKYHLQARTQMSRVQPEAHTFFISRE